MMIDTVCKVRVARATVSTASASLEFWLGQWPASASECYAARCMADALDPLEAELESGFVSVQ